MLTRDERERQLACQLHTGDELYQAVFLKECAPEKILSYIEWSTEEIESLQKDCNEKDEVISKLEGQLAEAERKFEELMDKPTVKA